MRMDFAPDKTTKSVVAQRIRDTILVRRLHTMRGERIMDWQKVIFSQDQIANGEYQRLHDLRKMADGKRPLL